MFSTVGAQTDSVQFAQRLEILQRIAEAQSDGSGPYPGMVPTYIKRNKKKAEAFEDDNIFFSALIAYTLQALKPSLTEEEKQLAKAIITKITPNYPRYQSVSGRPIYSFWPTDSTFVFHFSGSTNRHRMLPDDFDDTSIMLMSLGDADSLASVVHGIMQDYINKPGKRVRGVPREHKKLGAYSTWFGEQFPVTFDVCVAANTLLFVDYYDLQWTNADSATLEYIRAVLKKREHMKRPLYVAPHYARSALIIYHIARLMSRSDQPSLEQYRSDLINDARHLLADPSCYMEELILHSSLLMLGHDGEGLTPFEYDPSWGRYEELNMPYFIGNVPSYFSNFMRQPLTAMNVKIYNHYSPAFHAMLFFEYLVEKEKAHR